MLKICKYFSDASYQHDFIPYLVLSTILLCINIMSSFKSSLFIGLLVIAVSFTAYSAILLYCYLKDDF